MNRDQREAEAGYPQLEREGTVRKTTNNNLVIWLRDFHQAWNEEVRASQWFKRFYAKRPFWVQIQVDDDDDMVLDRHFSDWDEALACFEEVATAPEPDLSLFY